MLAESSLTFHRLTMTDGIPGGDQGTRQADQLIARSAIIDAALACAQCRQTGIDLQPEQVFGREVAVGQFHSRLHRFCGIETTMHRQVDRVHPVGPAGQCSDHGLPTCIRAHEDPSLAEPRGDRLRLTACECDRPVRQGVGEYQCRTSWLLVPAPAVFQHGRTGCVDDRIAFDERHPVHEQGVQWQMMQRVVGHQPDHVSGLGHRRGQRDDESPELLEEQPFVEASNTDTRLPDERLLRIPLLAEMREDE